MGATRRLGLKMIVPYAKERHPENDLRIIESPLELKLARYDVQFRLQQWATMRFSSVQVEYPMQRQISNFLLPRRNL
jgi:hypothetical protein